MIPHPRHIYGLLAILTLMLSASGCARLRNLPADKVFLSKNELKVHDAPENYKVSQEDLLTLARPEPNRRVLGFRFNHTVYLLVNKEKLAKSEELNTVRCEKKNEKRVAKGKLQKECKTWRMFWAYTVGEPTVVMDSLKAEKSASQMEIYLQKRGFLRSKVEPEYLIKTKPQKGSVLYHVYPGRAYTIRSVRYDVESKEMADVFHRVQRQLLADSGEVFNVTQLDADRNTITNFYNNNGYYDFNKEYITYDVDTTVGNYQVTITMRLQNQKQLGGNNGSELISTPHKKYYIGNIYVDTQYDFSNPDKEPEPPVRFDALNIYNESKSVVSKRLLSCIQGYNPGDLYKKESIDRTYKRYSQLGVFRATTIVLVPRQDSLSPHLNILDTYLRAAPEKKQGFSIDPHVTNRGGNMGIYTNPGYVNKNLWKGAERLEVRMIVGMEASQTLTQTTDAGGVGQLKRSIELNTFEIGPELTMKLPRLWPFGCDFTAKSSEPQTALSALYNYQRRPDYQRTLSQLRFSYSFIENPEKVTHFNVDLIEFSIIKIDKSQEFQVFLDRINDSFLANSYQNHLILSFISPTFTLNTQKARFQRTYMYLRTGLSGAGNFIHGMMQLFDAPRDEYGSYELFGIRYAQYLRGDADFRYYVNVNAKNAFVWRAYSGIGVPRKNLNAMPFEKNFFSGGSNGMRAWQSRTLGPGSYRDSLSVQNFNNIGEVKLEGNFEYRFKMTKTLNWALFMDAGNIWMLSSDPMRPGSAFKWDRFVSEIAINTGIGLRLDFDIFLVRLDLGMKLKDPAKIPGERWIGQPKDEYISYLRQFSPELRGIPWTSNAVLNLGIGFPF